jgi:putative transposase
MKENTTMAVSKSVTAREAVSELLAGEHSDVLRESVALMVREIMEVEVAQLAGAELGERAPDQRRAQRNGYRDRRWDTRVGEIELQIPKLRTGSYLPSFLEPRKRAEQALVAVVQEAYVNGVSTRKVDRLVEQMGLRGLSKDQVSRMCAWISRSRRSATGRLRAPIRTCGWTRRSRRSASLAASGRKR